ncbi:MAG: NFACT family protein [Candidatus ainarchaeum sp.]|nr:NFACT family protein [Candidatus ainarchaeum sp.]
MREIANVELGALAKELSRELSGARLQKFFELSENEFRIEFHAPGRGTLDLAIELKKRMGLTKYVRPAPTEPTQFAMQLRKRLEGAILESISQSGTDRVISIRFSSKDGPLSLVLEMFSSGNLILLDESGKITACYRAEKWADREIRRGPKYVLPSSTKTSPFVLSEAAIRASLSEKKLVACLASKIDMGGTYLEEVIARAGLKLGEKGSEIGENGVRALRDAFTEVESLLASPSPTGYYKNGALFDYGAFPMKKFDGVEGVQARQFKSFSELFDEAFPPGAPPEVAAGRSAAEGERERLEFTLKSQREAVSSLERRAAEAKAAGDMIYGNYAEVEAILNYIRSEKKRGAGWDEIEAGLNESVPDAKKIVKKLDKEKGTVLLDL